MAASFEESVLGQVLDGKYRLQQVRLRGAYGVVFQADEFFCRTFVRAVLVKVSRQTGMTDVTAPHFFGDAIRLAQAQAEDASRDESHFPRILNLGLLPQWNGCGMLVTEAVEGTPLLASPVKDLPAQLQAFKDLCRALAFLHERGIAHRELRPDAVVLSTGGVRVLGVGLAAAADARQALTGAAPELLAHLAPEALEGTAGAAADVYAAGLILYEWLTGGGPHLLAPWASSSVRGLADVARLKQALHFPAPSGVRGEIRQAMPWLDDVVLRCLAADPGRRFHHAGLLLGAIETCEAGGALPPVEQQAAAQSKAWTPLRRSDDPADALIREARRCLARGEFGKAIDQLDVHRPAEWAVVDAQGARILRVLGQAYVRRGDWRAGRECLEQLRAVQREQKLLSPQHYAVALSDLLRCYTQLALDELAEGVRQEARQL